MTAHIFVKWYETAHESEHQANLQIARALSKTLDAFIKDVLRQEHAIGHALTMEKMSANDRKHFLDINIAQYPSFLNLLWVSPEGIILDSHLREVEGQSATDWRHIQDIIGGREWTVSDLIIAKATGDPIISIARGIRDDRGQLLGIVAASIPSDRFDTVLTIERPQGSGHAVVDSKGMLVYRYPWIKPSWEQRNWIKDFPEFKEALSGKEISKTVFAPFEGRDRMVGFVPIPSIGWAASAGRTEEIAMAPIISQLFPQALLLLMVTTAAFGTALLFSRYIANSVRRLGTHAVALGSGDTSAPLVASGPTELRQLAEEFNKMAQNLRFREGTLRESEFHLARSQQLAHLGSWTLNIVESRLYWSDETYRLFGLQPGEFVPQYGDFLRFVHPEDRDRVDRAIHNALVEEPCETEYRIIRKGGEERYLQSFGETTFDKGGNPVKMEGYIQDITKRKQSEIRLASDLSALTRMHELSSRLLETEGLQPLLQEIMDAAVIIVGAEMGTFQLLEDDSLRIVAVHGHRQPFLDFFASAGSQASVCGEAMKCGERVIVPDIEKSPVLTGTPSLPVMQEAGVRAIQSTPVISRSGRLLGILTTQWRVPFIPDEHDLWRIDLLARQAADLIEHSLAEDALKKNEERYRALVTASSQVLYRMNPDWSEMLRLQGGSFISDREKPNRNWLQEYIHPDDQKQVLEVIAEAVQTGAVIEMLYRVRREDGSLRWTFSRAVPMRNDAGEIVEWFGSANDITERKNAEEMLRKSNEFISEIFDTVDGLIIVLDPNGRIVRFNAACERLTGWRADEVIGRRFWEFLVPEEQRANVLQVFQQLTSGHFPKRHENDWVLRDGSRRWITWANSVLLDAQGGIENIIGTGIDISERRTAEKALFDTHQRLRSLMNALPVGVSFSDDPTCQIITGNPTVLAQFEVGAQDNLSASASDAVAPGRQVRFFINRREISDTELPLQRAVAENREIPPIEIKCVLASGREWVMETSGAPIRGADGAVIGGVAVTVDITERKRTEDELHKSRDELELRVLERTAELSESERMFKNLSQEFHTLLNAISDTMVLLSPEMEILWTNRGYDDQLNEALSEEVIRSCDEFLHDLSVSSADSPVTRCFNTGEKQVSVVTHNGAVLNMSAFPIKEGERIRSILVLVSDITEKMAMQAEAMQAAHLASLGELAAGVAHEINNPITGIINYGQILINECSPESMEKDFGKRIVKEGERIGRIAKTLLLYARDGQEEKKPTRVPAILEESIILIHGQLRKEGIDLKIDLPDDLPEVDANFQQIQQCFINIINNARYALNERYPERHEDKRLEITGERAAISDRPYVRIVIYDQGGGISARELSMLTKPFFSTKPFGKGTGLGLNIAQKIITDHGGQLSFESTKGEFTRVIVDLPANRSGLKGTE
jgi:PAS domain S-box-containing protein